MGAVLGTRRQPEAPSTPSREAPTEDWSTKTPEGVRKACATFPFLKLKCDTRRKILEYLVCCTDRSAEKFLLRAEQQQWIREDEEGPPPSGRSLTLVGSYMVDIKLAGAPHSTAAALETLLSSSRLVGAVCTTMHSDYVVLRDAPKSINRAKPRSWLEHLYLRSDDELDDQGVEKELIARRRAGTAANLVRGVLRLASSAVEYRADVDNTGLRDIAGGITTPQGEAPRALFFHAPGAWGEPRRDAALDVLMQLQNPAWRQLQGREENDETLGPAIANARVLTISEANRVAPCNTDQIKGLLEYAVLGVAKHLRGRTLVALATSVKVLHVPPDDVDNAALGPQDYARWATELGTILSIFGDAHPLASSWTNIVPHPLDVYESRTGKCVSEKHRCEIHDANEPPITGHASLLKLMVEKNVKTAELSKYGDYGRQLGTGRMARYAPVGAARIDISIPVDSSVSPQADNAPFPSYYFFDVAAVSGAGTLLDRGLMFKLNTYVFNRGHLERAFIFVDFGERFRVLIPCKIPGMD